MRFGRIYLIGTYALLFIVERKYRNYTEIIINVTCNFFVFYSFIIVSSFRNYKRRSLQASYQLFVTTIVVIFTIVIVNTIAREIQSVIIAAAVSTVIVAIATRQITMFIIAARVSANCLVNRKSTINLREEMERRRGTLVNFPRVSTLSYEWSTTSGVVGLTNGPLRVNTRCKTVHRFDR